MELNLAFPLLSAFFCILDSFNIGSEVESPWVEVVAVALEEEEEELQD